MTTRESKITTIYPIAGGNGASYMTIKLAYALREVEKHKKIAVVDFDFTTPVLGEGLHDDEEHGIDMLVDKLNGEVLTNESFLANMVKLKKDIHLLRGSQLSHRFPFVTPEHLMEIVKFLKEEYDYIFIATSDKVIDSGTAVGLYNADKLLIVSRYNQKNEWRLKSAITDVKSYSNAKTKAVVYNFFEGQSNSNMSERYPKDWKVCGTLPYNSQEIDNKEAFLAKGLLKKRKSGDDTKETLDTLLLELYEIGGEKK